MKKGILYAEQFGQTKLQGSSVFASYLIRTVFPDISYEVSTLSNRFSQKLLYPFIREVFYPVFWLVYQKVKKQKLHDIDIVNFVSSTTLALSEKNTPYKKVLFLSCLYTLQITKFYESLNKDLSVTLLYYLLLPILRFLEKCSINNADLVIVPQKRMIKFIKENFSMTDEKIVYLPNFIEASKNVKSSSKNEFDIVYIGRLSKGKGIHLLSEIVKQMPKLNFAIIGEGKYSKELSEYKNVKFIGRANPEKRDEILSKSLLGIMPSLSETGPLVTLEMLQFGLPIIATTEGAGEYVTNGINGYIMDVNNFTNQSVKIINELINDKSNYKKMSSKAKESANMYISGSVFLKKLIKIIHTKLWENI